MLSTTLLCKDSNFSYSKVAFFAASRFLFPHSNGTLRENLPHPLASSRETDQDVSSTCEIVPQMGGTCDTASSSHPEGRTAEIPLCIFPCGCLLSVGLSRWLSPLLASSSDGLGLSLALGHSTVPYCLLGKSVPGSQDAASPHFFLPHNLLYNLEGSVQGRKGLSEQWLSANH